MGIFLQSEVESGPDKDGGDEARQVCFAALRVTEEQIIGILKEQEAGAATADVCRRHGISSATFYKWKAKYGGLDVSEARRLKALEDENGRLKKLLAESMLNEAALRDLLGKKW